MHIAGTNACMLGEHGHAHWYEMLFYCMLTCSCATQCRFNVSCKYIQPPNPEVDAAAHVPNADDFWEWVDTAVSTTKRMIEFDTTDRQARVVYHANIGCSLCGMVCRAVHDV